MIFFPLFPKKQTKKQTKERTRRKKERKRERKIKRISTGDQRQILAILCHNRLD
jgi:hypothetical protein